MQAVKAASLSFAPYSQCPEGFVMECIDGGSFTGSAVESVAFNPSVPPVLVALNQRNLSSSRDAAITACAQAKLATTLNNSLPIAKAILRSLTDTHVNVVLMECL
jgi:cytidine deaminase